MEMFTPLAIAVLLFTSIDLAVSQRKVSRNVQVGADIKTVNNFACPEEFGYYPHPSDCTQYYVCVYGGALLESCTGGLMYSHELQTCDWPRNVGCDGDELSSGAAPATSSPSRGREEPQPRQRYTPPTPPPAQPAAIVTSRGQPRQLHHNQQEIIKQRQQQQLYADAEETLPPAEEIESDRQQRVYRGQPSTLGQVQKDRDGLRHSNAISSYSGRGERIGVISFGTQQQQQPQQQYSDNFDDDLVTNDLTLKRRRKRQTSRSRHRTRETTWRIGHPDLKKSRFTMNLNLQPPPVPVPAPSHNIYTQSYPQNTYAPPAQSSHNNEKEFKPFVPQYQRVPAAISHTIANKEPFSPLQNTRYTVFSPSTTPSGSENYSYFKIGSTLRPFTETPSSTVREPEKKNTVNYYQDPGIVLQPQFTHVINHNTSSIKISNPSIKSGNTSTSTTTALPVYNEDNSEESQHYEDSSEEYFGPPSSYFNTKNKYEEIENPFANPHFDFDQFLASLRDDKFVSKPKAKVVPSAATKVEAKKNQRPQHEDYYYYADDDDGSKESKQQTSSQAPRKIYSSQIKPNYSAKAAKPSDDYYYEEYEDDDDDDGGGVSAAKDKHREGGKVQNSSKTTGGDVKYSAKYQGKPAKVSKGSKSPAAVSSTAATTPYYYTQPLPKSKIQTSESFIATVTTTSTTQRPKYTARHRAKAPVPSPTAARPSRNKQRHRLTDDDSTRPRVEQSSAAPVQPAISTATATARTLYNSTQYNNNYDPYYAIYDDDVELYKDVDYSQHYNTNNNNNNNNNAQQQTPQQSYRRTPAPAVQSTTQQVQEEQPKRGSYIQTNYNAQDLYQPSTVQDYNDDNSYNSQVDDQNSYRQINRQPSRGDRNDLNYIEEATTKRTTTTTTTTRKPTTTTTRTTTTSTTTQRTIPPKKSTIPSRAVTTEKERNTHNTLRDDPGQYPISSNSSKTSLGLDTKTITVTYRPSSDTIPDRDSLNVAVVNKPAPFTLPEHLTTDKPIVFHYITKSSRSTALVSSTELPNSKKLDDSNHHQFHVKNSSVIVPTTYSPPKFFLKGLLPKPHSTSATSPVVDYDSKPKSLKFVRKLISPLNVNYGLSSVTGASFESAEKLVSDVDVVNIKNILPPRSTTTTTTTTSTTTTTTTTSQPEPQPQSDYELSYDASVAEEDDDERLDVVSKLRHFIEPNLTASSSETSKRFRTTVEIPQAHDLFENIDYKQIKQEPDQSPEYKPKPNPKPIVLTTTTDSPQNTSIPARVSRVNNAIKSLIAFGGARRQNVKCNENADAKCNDPKPQRTSTRGRGSAHYASSPNVANNEVTVTVNRGTPPSRSRPTLKPSTSIVSKASEFVDIYRFPAVRPDPIYPQPQPDKTAAKCRKDVCLLPDCSCGGKEIPGNLPVEEVPQIVLLTFDDAVNDLNKQYYVDLFENGRTNPNGCPISATFYVSHEWTDYSQVQNLYADGHELASHTVSHSFGEQFSQKKWTREVAGQREILSAYGGVHLEDVRGMRAPFLSVGGNKMFKMLYDSNFTYDSSMPIYENKPPSWPYTLDYKLFHDCMIPPCPTRSYPGVWEVPMVMWQDLNGGRCSMGDACSNPPDSEGVFKVLTKNFQRHYTTNRAPFGLFYHAAWFTQPHHKEGFIQFLDSILAMKDVWLLTNWQAIQWIRDPTPTSRLGSFQPFQCDYSNRPKRCNNPKVCNLWHKSGVRYMRTCQPCPDIYPWTGNTGIRSSRIDNDIED